MRITVRSHVTTTKHHELEFEGLSFCCDSAGNVDVEVLAPAALKNLEKALKSGEQGRIRSYVSRYRNPAIGECECGLRVWLANITNTCECGLDYNISGQKLSPRENWGEETGETWYDCI